MTKHQPDRPTNLAEFPQELQTVLTSVQTRQAPRSLIERVTEKALALELVDERATTLTIQAARKRMGASRRGLIYALAALALTAFLTVGFFGREKEKAQIASTSEDFPALSAIAILPLLQWDKHQFEQDLKRMETELRDTTEAVQIRAVRDEIDQALAEFKK
jgi:hypothetical protein